MVNERQGNGDPVIAHIVKMVNAGSNGKVSEYTASKFYSV